MDLWQNEEEIFIESNIIIEWKVSFVPLSLSPALVSTISPQASILGPNLQVSAEEFLNE